MTPKPTMRLSARQSKNRPRVWSQALCQSMSVLHRNGFEKDFLQRHRQDVGRDRSESHGLFDECVAAGVRERRQDAPLPADADDARCVKGDVGSLAVEHELHAAILSTQI